MRYQKILIYAAIFFVIIPMIGVASIIAYNYISYPRYSDSSRHITATSTSDKQRDNFWIGETGSVGPLFNGQKQAPFICTTLKNGLGQPIIDHDEAGGSAVFPEFLGFPLTMLNPIGYSKNCSIKTRVDYFYFSNKQQKFIGMIDSLERNRDMNYIEINGKQVPFIVRLERGTINRFIYGIAMLAPYAEKVNSPSSLNNSAWNNKLVYKFQGGIGIGRYQGSFSLNKKQALHFESLRRGYAVAYSSGTRTSTQYNLKLAEETALMVKRHFVAVYGKPQYTVGLGASGGAIQQYVIAQNNQEIIDAAIPQASYPDMITETITVADCDLLERYFDSEYQQDPNSYWANWMNRSTVQGVAANTTAVVEKWQRSPAPKPGADECVAGWRGTVPTIFNPNWAHLAYTDALQQFKFPDHIVKKVKWSHWDDLQNIYPRDANGYAANSWDNVGVQYGLLALRSGAIDSQMFLDLNACVGGWKQPSQMRKGDFPWDKQADSTRFDAWDQANMNLSQDCKNGKPAQRSHGDVATMNQAYLSGHVFRGDIDIPIIDVRWYLEPVLNIHHLRGSFSSRARIQKNKGHSDNQVIWVAECSELDPVTLKWSCRYDPTGDALDVMDTWMQQQREFPSRSIVQNKPPRAIDSCMAVDGRVMYAGDDAWNGILKKEPVGECVKKFEMFSSSRMQAGADIKGDIFKCSLISVKKFALNGGYNVNFSPAQLERLKRIFPEGVCDYSQADMGLPNGQPIPGH